MKFNLEGKTAVITGGGSGIGKAISQVFGEHGAFVYILDLSTEKAAETIADIKSKGGNGEAILCNVADQKIVKEVL